MRSLALSAALVVATTLVTLPARADQTPGHERVDFTAYTLRRGELSLGIWTEEYGILDEVTVGTYLPTWFAFPILHAPIATGYLKVRDWFFGPLAVSLRGEVVYLDASSLSSELSMNHSTKAGVFVLPLEVAASARIAPRFTGSLQLTYVSVGVGGDTSDTSIDTGLGAALATTSVSLSTLFELRVSRVVAFTLRETLLLGVGDVVAKGQYTHNGLRIDADLGMVSHYRRLLGNVIPGVAFSWSHVNLQLGVGYGNVWLPVVWLPTPKRTVVPDANFYVRF
jgi:hypothetical protein